MRTNTFGEAYIQPGDNLMSVLDDRGVSTDVYARFLEDVAEGDGPTPGWGCELADNEDGETSAYVEGFETREALAAYLNEARVRIEG